jgi:hypothetical protein
MFDLDRTLPSILFALGLGFLLANLRLALQLLQALRLRSQARLTWPSPKPPFYPLLVAMGITLYVVLITEVMVLVRGHVDRPPETFFGEAMMFLYYGCLMPLSQRLIGRGFYEEGVWVDSGYMPYGAIGGLTWREEPEITLVLIPRVQRLARRLVVPSRYYAEARRLLRDKIAGHDLHFTGKPLDLGAHDERDDV